MSELDEDAVEEERLRHSVDRCEARSFERERYKAIEKD